MVSARIDDAQRIAVTVEVKIDLLNLRRGKVFKVHRRKAAHTRRHLVEQAGGLAEVHVFGKF